MPTPDAVRLSFEEANVREKGGAAALQFLQTGPLRGTVGLKGHGHRGATNATNDPRFMRAAAGDARRHRAPTGCAAAGAPDVLGGNAKRRYGPGRLLVFLSKLFLKCRLQRSKLVCKQRSERAEKVLL